MKGDRERCLESGADEYISKPIQIRQFLETLEKVLTPSAAEESAEAGQCASCASQDEPTPGECENSGAGHGGVWSPGAALQATGGDRRLLCELAESFLEERPTLMADLKQAAEASDPARLQFAAHVLKGSMRCFNAPGAMQSAERLEAMGRDRRLDRLPDALTEVETNVDRLAAALSDHLDREVNQHQHQ
jgi:two-component system, sensor histidine kinase and response regulator